MGLFKKVKDILFDEEEYTEQIKITPEMRNEEIPSKEEKRVFKTENKTRNNFDDEFSVASEPKKVQRPIKPERPEKSERIERVERVEKPREDYSNSNISERELFKSDSTFPFLDFNEEEFENQKPVRKPPVKETNIEDTIGPKRSTNVFEFERKKKSEKRAEYSRHEKAEIEQTERRKFKPSPIISPVYGVLNQDYNKEDLFSKKESEMAGSNIDINEVRNRAFGDKKESIIDSKMGKPKYYEESKTVTITKPEEKKKKVKTIDELLEDTSDVTVSVDKEYDDVLPKLDKRKNYIEEKEDKQPTQEMKLPSENEDTLENDLFDLIDSMYDNKEEGE